MKKYFKVLLSLLLIFSSSTTFLKVEALQSYHLEKNILYLNSYHSGYKWSDDIYDGIKSVLHSNYGNIKIQIEYMDTQRVIDKKYLHLLLDTYRYKFNDRQFDLIISSDDAAFEFLLDHGDELFPNTPVIFCGVNYFEAEMLDNHPHYTGVIEGFDIDSTIDSSLTLHPDTKTVYYVVDDTPTGVSIMKEFSKVMPKYENELDFIKLDGINLDEIITKAQTLPADSIILYLIYFKDNEGNHYEYYEAVSMLEQNSTIPIYGVWNFTLGHGIIGGKLTSGFYQGKTAAEIALRVLNEEKPSNIPVITEKTTKFEFDYKQLNKHNLQIESLPQNSIIINVEKPTKQQVLILHSYNKGLKWTDDLETGIKSELGDSIDSIEFTYEFMDVKNHTDPVYLQNIYEILIRKYRNKQFDLIITTDDVAFNFIRMYHGTIFKDVPIIFSGVNYFEESMLDNNNLFTGVVESYDLKGTIDIALEINPETNNIIVINDTTVTGQANHRNLDLIKPYYLDKVSFEIWDDYNMPEIQKKVNTLENDSIILLLSFNRDKSNNTFTYDESISLIAENANVPIYGVWDFYLGEGLLGGVLTSGITHGAAVGEMALSILNGVPPSKIPVILESPNIPMFDYNILKEHNISSQSLPIGSIVINKPSTILDHYRDNKHTLITLISIFSILYIVVLLLHLKASNKKERYYALTDLLTGIPNRRAGLEHLAKQIRKSGENGLQTTICFIDVNNLKIINDTFGHKEGDNLLTTVSSLINSKLRDVDMICRFAGDEFLIIFYDLNIKEAKQTLNIINNAIDEHNKVSTKNYNINISYGFAQYNDDDCNSIDELIEKADNAMYENKSINLSVPLKQKS